MDPAQAAPEAAVPQIASWMRLAHVLGIIVFLGGSLSGARLLGLLAKADETTRTATAALGRKVYLSLTLPAGILFLITGLHLAFADPWKVDYFHQDWFILKLVLVATILLVDHLLVLRPLKRMAREPREGAAQAALAGAGFWLLGLLYVCVLAALFVFRK
jgi:uncharacterized membrane protein